MTPFRFRKLALRCSLSLLSLACVLPTQSLAQEIQHVSAVVQKPTTAMVSLQVMVETFALEHRRYPASLYELHQAAQHGGYGLETVTSKDKETGKYQSVLNEISSQLYLDTQELASIMPARRLHYLWQVQNGKLHSRWQSPSEKVWQQKGAVLYVPILPQDPNSAIRAYVIMAINSDGSIQREKGQFYYTNGDTLKLTTFEQAQWNALQHMTHWPDKAKTTYNAAESSSSKM
jgi:hypothetical protein